MATRDFRAAMERGRLREALRVYDEQPKRDPTMLRRLAESVLEQEARANAPEARRRAFEAMRGAGSAARSVLERTVERPYDPLSRARALLLLARIEDAGARDALLAEGANADAQIAALAVELLRPDADTSRLIELLRVPQSALRLAAARMLARASPNADILLALAPVGRSDPELTVRVEAVRGLGGQGPTAADTLLERLEASESAMRLAVCDALVRADSARAAQRLERELLGEPSELAIHAAFALLVAGVAPDAALAQLARALWHPNAPLRSQAAVALMAVRSAGLLELAKARLPHEGARSIRLSLALALGAEREEGRAGLQSLLDQDDVPGAQAAVALARAGDARARERLRTLLASKQARVRAVAAISLARELGRPHEVRALLVDPDPGVRVSTAAAVLTALRAE